MVTSLSALGVNALLTRLLSPEDMGAYFLTLSIVAVASTIAQLGLATTVLKLIAEFIGIQQPSKARLAIRLTLRLFGIGLLIVIYFLAYGGGEWIAKHWLHSETIAQIIGLSAIWMTLLATQTLFAEIFRGFHDIRLATIFSGLTTSFISMVLFLLLWLHQGYSDLQQIIWLTLISGLISIILSSLFLWKKTAQLPIPKGDEINTADITRIASPLWINSLMLLVLGQADIWIMGMFATPAEIAIYGASTRMMALITMPLLVVNAIVPPIIAEMYAQNKLKELESKLRFVATLAGFPSMLAIIILFFYADSLLALLFGEYYRTGGTILIILGIGQLVNVWAGSCGQVLMLTGNQRIMMMITLFCGLLTIIMAWYFVQLYSGLGVALASAIGMALQNILMLLFVKNKLNIWTHFSILNMKYSNTI